ncbi:MAG: hypothetical protein FD155_440 [Bacteroidetes bacterium]|nr:MAG: hypothetical protein FD155_440 [Bacteroidota bacterium]
MIVFVYLHHGLTRVKQFYKRACYTLKQALFHFTVFIKKMKLQKIEVHVYLHVNFQCFL